MFQTACSGHWTNMTPSTTAAMTRTSVERRRYEPGRDDRDAREHPDPPRQPQRRRDRPRRSAVDVGRRAPRTIPSIVCSTGPGRTPRPSPDSCQLPAGTTFLYRMLCVYVVPREQRQRPHRGEQRRRPRRSAIASRHVRRGRRVSHSSERRDRRRRSRRRRATSTRRRDQHARAATVACRCRASCRARRARTGASASAIVKENSPASVLAMLPP